MKSWTTWVLVLATACGGDSSGDDAGMEPTDGASSDSSGDDDAADDDDDDDDDDDAAESTGASDPDTGGPDDDDDDDDSGTSTGESGLPSQVTWETLLPVAEQAAAASNALAELSLISAQGMQADGTIDLTDLEADGKIEFRFSEVSSQTGVSVNFSASSFDPMAEAYEPSSVYPVNGNGFVSDPLWDVAALPSWAEIAQMFGAAGGCGGFSGHEDDVISIRVDSFFPVMVIRARTATAETQADVPFVSFPACM